MCIIFFSLLSLFFYSFTTRIVRRLDILISLWALEEGNAVANKVLFDTLYLVCLSNTPSLLGLSLLAERGGRDEADNGRDVRNGRKKYI